jgi:hypothetical protein
MNVVPLRQEIPGAYDCTDDLDDHTFDASVTTAAPRGGRAKLRWGVRIVLGMLLIGGELGFAYRSEADRLRREAGETLAPHGGYATAAAGTAATGARSSAPVSAAASSPTPAPVPAAAPSMTASSTPAVAAGLAPAARPAIPPDMGLVITASAPPGHRIYVDERVVGQTPRSVLVTCGMAFVKIGSAGRTRALEVPCGQEISLAR